MKAILAILALAAIASAVSPAEFKAWAQQNGKTYTASEFARRMSVFAKNVERVKQLNAEHETATFGLNKFADLSEEEFAAQYLGFRAGNATRLPKVNVQATFDEAKDWRTEKNPARVNPVTDQKQCGSCWAFSAIAGLENYDAVNSGTLKKLSEQQLVDCDKECREDEPSVCDGGCNGGWMVTAMTYAIKNGVEARKDYEYTGVDGKCKYAKGKVVAKFTGKSIELESGDEEGLQQHCNDEGPVSVAVNANPFQLYTGGIITKNCPASINHGVAVVGWGKEGSTNFWIVRNSWGASWGEKGYCRVKLGSNLCGIATHATIIQ